MKKQENTKTVVVTGDITIDWNIARIRRMEGVIQVWNAEDLTKACYQAGGAAMLADLITSIAENLKQSYKTDVTIKKEVIPQGLISPSDNRFHHSYALWSPFTADERQPKSGEKVWRVLEFLGLYRSQNTKYSLTKTSDDAVTADVIVIDDANLGFRDDPSCWPKAISSDHSNPWIVLKMAKPIAAGKLWHHLVENYAKRLIVITSIDDLRSTMVQISREISWERTAQDIIWEFSCNPHIRELTRCGDVIVSFGTAGAVLFSGKSSENKSTLFFDPNAMEGEWGTYKGSMLGFTTCMAGSITRELIKNSNKPDFSCGIQSGVSAMRLLHKEGYGTVDDNQDDLSLTFPTSKISAKLSEENRCLATIQIKNPTEGGTSQKTSPIFTRQHDYWTILEEKNPDTLENVAEQIVINGLESALPDVPIRCFGALKVVDRNEIESLNNISSLIREYCKSYNKTPLSIAVFGPPGSGKSFAVEQVANSVLPDRIEKPLNFNLSQLGGTENLPGTFHQIRDIVLAGKIPLVFWDEFDSPLQNSPLGWLRHFLAPMQDGTFNEGLVTHPIGRSIFVFAGGSCRSMAEFEANSHSANSREIKIPDFISRLKGFLNILGPNRQGFEKKDNLISDPYYIIRRAIVLRSILERTVKHLILSKGKKQILNIDGDVLRAFLLIKEYKHGARSIGAIITMSSLSGKTAFDRSSLPTEEQLNLHVDGTEFYSLVHGLSFNDDVLEKLARHVHSTFCHDLVQKGYKYGLRTNNQMKEHSALKPYDELSEEAKKQNRDFVRDIPNKLSSIGYVIVPARSNETPVIFKQDEIEKLAIMEHERWIRQQLADGWKFEAQTSKPKKHHKNLVPWDKLAEVERDKDRVLVRSIPALLSKAGYTITKAG